MFTYSTVLPRCQMRVMAAFERCLQLVSADSGDQRLMLDAASAGTAVVAIGGAARTRVGLF